MSSEIQSANGLDGVWNVKGEAASCCVPFASGATHIQGHSGLMSGLHLVPGLVRKKQQLGWILESWAGEIFLVLHTSLGIMHSPSLSRVHVTLLPLCFFSLVIPGRAESHMGGRKILKGDTLDCHQMVIALTQSAFGLHWNWNAAFVTKHRLRKAVPGHCDAFQAHISAGLSHPSSSSPTSEEAYRHRQ